jgi:hypothetical protein
MRLHKFAAVLTCIAVLFACGCGDGGDTQKDGGFNGQSQPDKTFHMTEEGYVIIAYTKKGVVKKISMEQDRLIQSINKKDLIDCPEPRHEISTATERLKT